MCLHPLGSSRTLRESSRHPQGKLPENHGDGNAMGYGFGGRSCRALRCHAAMCLPRSPMPESGSGMASVVGRM